MSSYLALSSCLTQKGYIIHPYSMYEMSVSRCSRNTEVIPYACIAPGVCFSADMLGINRACMIILLTDVMPRNDLQV